MEKRLLVAIALCVGILAGWTWLSATLWPPPPPPPPAVAQQQVPVPPGAAPSPAPAAGAPAPAPAAEPPTEIPLRTERLSALVSSRGGATLRRLDVWGCTHHAPGDGRVLGDPGSVTAWVDGADPALAIGITGLGGEPIARANWKLESTADGARASIRAGDAVDVVSELTPSRDPAHPYHISWDVSVSNVSGKPGSPCVLEVVGPWLPAVVHVIPEDGVIVAPDGERVEQLAPSEIIGKLMEEPSHERRSETGWRFVGMRSDFYLCAVAPAEGTDLPPATAVGFRAALAPGPGPGAAPIETAAATLRIPFTIPEAGATTRWKFLVYAGPNSRDWIAVDGSPYAPLEDAFPDRSFLGLRFGAISRLLGWLLTVFADRVGLGWGLAVCALTVLVRGALFPLSRKSQISMRIHAQKMAKLKPKLDAMKAKHADNPKKQQEMTMKLFREEKVSILPGGCLLAFLQMPVWISLYATLQTTFEMRHASFLWFEDLTGADHLLELPFTRGWWILDGWFNLLPLLMMVTWWGSAAMQPLPEDPEQRTQAKMMRWIPLLFGVMLYSTASGLTLYMTLSALWSIGESWLIKKVWISKLEPMPAPAPAVAQRK